MTVSGNRIDMVPFRSRKTSFKMPGFVHAKKTFEGHIRSARLPMPPVHVWWNESDVWVSCNDHITWSYFSYKLTKLEFPLVFMDPRSFLYRWWTNPGSCWARLASKSTPKLTYKKKFFHAVHPVFGAAQMQNGLGLANSSAESHFWETNLISGNWLLEFTTRTRPSKQLSFFFGEKIHLRLLSLQLNYTNRNVANSPSQIGYPKRVKSPKKSLVTFRAIAGV